MVDVPNGPVICNARVPDSPMDACPNRHQEQYKGAEPTPNPHGTL